MKIAIGADHRGAEAAGKIAERLRKQGHEIVATQMPMSGEACDYPEPAYAVGQMVAKHQAETAVLICGTGVGMCMAVNKIPGISAANVHDEITAEISRSSNDANVICLSADLLGLRLMEQVIDQWLKTPFAGGRHERRLAKIVAIEQGKDPRAVGM
ncbi:MAG: RpiB/LacA/LacB family sugar-phosphate isomerase [Phycisphaerales bacterium]